MDNEKYIKQELRETASKLIELDNKIAILKFIDTLIDNIDNEKIIDYLFNEIVIKNKCKNHEKKGE